MLRQRIFLELTPFRAAKKAKTEAVPQSDDLINIFKDRKDPEIKPIEEYPLWLLELALPIMDPINASIALKSDNQAIFSEGKDVQHMRRSIKRLRIKDQNRLGTLNDFSIESPEFVGNINFGNKVKQREEELQLAEKAKDEAEEAQEEDDDDEEGPKKVRVVVDREKERKEEEEFKAKLQQKKK